MSRVQAAGSRLQPPCLLPSRCHHLHLTCHTCVSRLAKICSCIFTDGLHEAMLRFAARYGPVSRFSNPAKVSEPFRVILAAASGACMSGRGARIIACTGLC